MRTMRWLALVLAMLAMTSCDFGLRQTVPVVATDTVVIGGTAHSIIQCVIYPPASGYFQVALIEEGVSVDGAGNINSGASNGNVFDYNLPYSGDYYGNYDLSTAGFQWIVYPGGSLSYDGSVAGSLIVEKTSKGLKVKSGSTFGGTQLSFDYEGTYILN